MQPINISVIQLMVILMILWYVATLFNYPMLIMLYKHSVDHKFPTVFTKHPNAFEALGIVGVLAMVLYMVTWIGYFFCGRVYLMEGIAAVLYFPAAMYIPAFCEAALFKKDKMLDDMDKKPIKVSRMRIICGFIGVTLFAISSMPYHTIAEAF